MGEATMIALSVQQPWAYLIVNGHKPVENRAWYTKHRGLILIHAGKKFDKDGFEWLMDTQKEHGIKPSVLALATAENIRGGFVGVANVVEVEHGKDMASEDCTGFYPVRSSWHDIDQWGWYLEDAAPLPEIVPWKGQLKLFAVPIKKVPGLSGLVGQLT